MSLHVLIVEDDESLARLLHDNLVFEGFAVDCVADGVQAIERARARRPDLVLLDIMLPGASGFDVCRTLSASRDRVPIIIMTARAEHQDKIRGLDLGADDYVTKPFALDELLARIHAVLRRSQPAVPAVAFGDVAIDFVRMRALKAGQPLPLTSREFAVLHHLAIHAGKVVTRDELLRVVWGCLDAPLTRTVDTFVARLRRKIEPNPRQPIYIRTAHGDGYRLTISPD